MSPIAIFLLFSMLAVIFFDATRFIIPNWLVGGLLLVYPLAVYLSPAEVDWKMALVAMLCVFAVGYVIFAKNWMGGGDIKLITVLSLWVGLKMLPDFLMAFGLLGGLLSLSVWSIRKILPHFISKRDGLHRLWREGEPVPYGLAIAVAFLILLVNDQVPAVSFH